MITHPRRPKADRLPARHAHTCHAPSGFAAGASRPSLGRQTTPSLAPPLSLSQLLTLGLERGMYRGLCCAVGPAIPPPTPTPAHGTHCPPFGRSAASAFGAAPSALAAPPHQCPARFIGSSAECTFPSPTFRFCSLFSALPANPGSGRSGVGGGVRGGGFGPPPLPAGRSVPQPETAWHACNG